MAIQPGEQIHRGGFQRLATGAEQQPFVPAMASHFAAGLYLGKTVEVLEPGQGLRVQWLTTQPQHNALLTQLMGPGGQRTGLP